MQYIQQYPQLVEKIQEINVDLSMVSERLFDAILRGDVVELHNRVAQKVEFKIDKML